MSEEELEGYINHSAHDNEIDVNNIKAAKLTPRGIHRCTRAEIDANFYESHNRAIKEEIESHDGNFFCIDSPREIVLAGNLLELYWKGIDIEIVKCNGPKHNCKTDKEIE